MRQPLCIDLFAGLGGFTEGFLAESWDCVGFDIERHQYGDRKYPAQLVLQDVLTLHGRQFKDASCIVASPPCQFFSYCAMPWSRAKQLAADVRADPSRLAKELALFNACFRIQREASEAAGHHIPMVVENVRGAESWVGPATAKYGSRYLWGDVPALLPFHQAANGSEDHKGFKRAWRECEAIGHWSSKSPQRKAWSAEIAKVPLALSRHLARSFKDNES